MYPPPSPSHLTIPAVDTHERLHPNSAEPRPPKAHPHRPGPPPPPSLLAPQAPDATDVETHLKPHPNLARPSTGQRAPDELELLRRDRIALWYAWGDLRREIGVDLQSEPPGHKAGLCYDVTSLYIQNLIKQIEHLLIAATEGDGLPA